MGSTRLPGKVLHPIKGKPMLGYLIDRLLRCDGIGPILVATTCEKADDRIAKYCRSIGIGCHRGSATDVAGRFKQVVQAEGFEAFVRICGDRPLLDRRIVESCLGLFHGKRFNLVSNIFPKSFPAGQTVEILNAEVFLQTYPVFDAKDDFEHVTPYFYRNNHRFSICNFQSRTDSHHIHLAVDTAEDMALLESILSQMTRPHWEYGLDETLEIYHGVRSDQGGTGDCFGHS